MSNSRAETSKRDFKEIPKKKKMIIAKEALKKGCSTAQAAEQSGLSDRWIRELIKNKSDFAKAALEGEKTVSDIVHGVFTKIALDDEHPKQLDAAEKLAKLKRLEGFGVQQVEVTVLPSTILESIK